MDIEDVARDLYALPPEGFTRARNARAAEAKAGGDPALASRIRDLRKPTTGAWLLNSLARDRAAEVRDVVELGARLRAAQGTLSADELRALDRRRRELTGEVVELARSLGAGEGRRISAPVLTTVEQTLRSAMIDAAAGAALSTGLLVDTFALTGLEPLDAAEVLAVPELLGAPPAQPQAPRSSAEGPGRADRQRVLDRARRALEAARDRASEAQQLADAATERLEEVRRRRARLERERAELQARLDEVVTALAAAEEDERAETRVHAEAADRVATAADAVEVLEEGLAALDLPESERP